MRSWRPGSDGQWSEVIPSCPFMVCLSYCTSNSKTFPSLNRKGAILFWAPGVKMECPCQGLMFTCFSRRQLQQLEGALWFSEVKTKADISILVDECRVAAGNPSPQSSHQRTPALVPSCDGCESQTLFAMGSLVTGQCDKVLRMLLSSSRSSACSQLGRRSTDNTQLVNFLMGLMSWTFRCLQG